MRLAGGALLFITLGLAACSPDGSSADAEPLTLPTGELDELIVLELVPGEGEPVEVGDTVRVHYTGWLYDPEAADRRGRQFDSSRGGRPYEFRAGLGNVIRGWDEGIPGMRVGGRRYLFLPPEHGYGERGTSDGSIPPDAALLFDVELLAINPSDE